MQKKKMLVLWGACGLIVLGGVFTGVALAGDEEEAPAALTAPFVIKAINAASAAQKGYITEVDVERKENRVVVEVDLLTIEAQKYEVTVDAVTSQVLSVEKDDDEADGKNVDEDKKGPEQHER